MAMAGKTGEMVEVTSDGISIQSLNTTSSSASFPLTEGEGECSRPCVQVIH